MKKGSPANRSQFNLERESIKNCVINEMALIELTTLLSILIVTFDFYEKFVFSYWK